MEGLVNMEKGFWRGRKVFITGHTGFKGSWLSLMLHRLGAKIYGYALNPPTNPSLFELCQLNGVTETKIGDIRDGESLKKFMKTAEPEIVIHMAAQPLVRESYVNPAETYEINVMGTVNLFEAVRQMTSVKALINVTTDKCYENKEWFWGYRENEPMGGHDPYSNSKACSELVTSAYRNSFFHVEKYSVHGLAVASARAGNVIGGGDWARDRLIPDCMNSLAQGNEILIRNPLSIRPWQHVLEPLSGYMILAQKLVEEGVPYAEGWNFGPNENDAKNVEWVVRQICHLWDGKSGYKVYKGDHPHEANYLKLDCSKAKMKLGWEPKWDIHTALKKVIEWNKGYIAGQNASALCIAQIEEYQR